MATGTVGLLLIAGAATSAFEMPSGNGTQLAAAMNIPSHAATINNSPDTQDRLRIASFAYAGVSTKAHASVTTSTPTHTAATQPTTSTTPTPTVPTPSYTPPTTSTPSTPNPTPTPTQSKTTAVVTAPSSGKDLGASLLAEAMTRAGDPYVYAAAGPSSFDCSGLIYWAALQIGISNMPRDTYGMLGQGVSSGLLVQTWSPQPGDLAFFGSGHVELVTSRADYTWGAQQPGKSVGYNEYYPGSYAPSAFYRVT